MPQANDRATSIGIALLFFLAFVSTAQSRHRSYHWFSDRLAPALNVEENEGSGIRDQRLRGAPRGTLGPLIDQLVRDCNREVLELQNFPVESISQTVSPHDDQVGALNDIRSLAAQAADGLALNCPKQMPTWPGSRLDVLDSALEAVQVALQSVRPPIVAFYESLTERQKARLIARYLLAGEHDVHAENPPRRPSRRKSAEAPNSSDVRQAWNCDEWQGQLRAWPLGRIELGVKVAPRQRASFYALAASVQRAADMLADTCPRASAITPIEAIESLKQKIDAMRQSIAIIRPDLGHFDRLLEGIQRSRFVEIM